MSTRKKAPASGRNRGLDVSGLEKVIALLRASTGRDFSLYKKSTLARRVERRMAAARAKNTAAYLRLLEEDKGEARLLLGDLLIGVTRFFREPEAWEKLKSKGLPGLIAARPKGGILRAWVPACSTGEEAYTLAMAFLETVEKLKPSASHSIQIFATDLDAGSVARARTGLYTAAAAASAGKTRLKRFFTREGDCWRVNKEVRELITFAQHDVTADPPFNRLDLMTCRNLLIYLEPDLQKRLLDMFHHVLQQNGLLLLGSSETTVNAAGLFMPLPGAGRPRLYRRNGTSSGQLHGGFFASPAKGHGAAGARTAAGMNVQALAEILLLKDYAPAAVLSTDKGDIVYISGRTGKYLEPASGKPALNLFKMARESIAAPLNEAFARALRRKEPVRLRAGGAVLSVRPLAEPEALRGLVLTVFEECSADKPGKAGPAAGSARLAELAGELRRSRAELQATLDEVRSSQEELTSSNEELQSANEELQSTNEELSISKEELQALNERYRGFIETTSDSVWETDAEGRYTYVSPQFEQLLGYSSAEILGRKPFDFMPPAEAERVRAIFRDLAGRKRPFKQLENVNRRKDGSLITLETNGMPLFDDNGSLKGYWGMDRDITARRRTEQDYRTLFTEMLNGFALHEIILDDDGRPADYRFIMVNPAFERMTGLKNAQVAGRTALELFPGLEKDWVERYGRVAATGEPAHFEQYAAPLGKHFEVTAFRPEPGRFACIFEDVTDRKRAEASAREKSEELESYFNRSLDLLCIADTSGRFVKLNPEWERTLGYKLAELEGKPFLDFVHPEDRAETKAQMSGLTTGGSAIGFENRYRRKDGSYRWIEWRTPQPVGGHIYAAARDVTDRRAAEEKIRENELIFNSFLEHSPVFIFFKDKDIRAVRLSRNYEAMLGMPVEKALGKTMDELFPSELSKGMVADDKRILAEGRTIVVQEDLNGRHFETTKFPIYMDGKPHMLAGFTVDITERREAEEKLKQNLFFLKEAERVGSVGSYRTDLAAGRWESSETLDRIFGIGPGYDRSVTGWLDIVHPDDKEMMGRYLTEEVLGKRRNFDKEYRVRRVSDGQTRWVHGRGEVTFDKNGKGLQMVGLIRDITERRLAEEERGRLLERIRLATDAAGLAVWDWDVVNNLLVWDDRMYGLYGFRKEDFGGAYEAWLKGVHPEDKQFCEEAVRLALAGEKPYDIEFRALLPDGAVRHIKANGAVLRDAAGAAVRMIGVNLDITERRKAEEERERLTAALLANKHELENVLYITTHDLRTPLVNIQCFSKILAEHAGAAGGPDAAADPEAAEAWHFTDIAVQRMDSMISGLLQFSRTGRNTPVTERLDMNIIASKLLGEMGPRLQEAGAVAAADAMPPCLADAGHVQQVLANLLDNAVKYRSPERPLEIKISAAAAGRRVSYRVSDNGRGVSPDNLGRIGQLFYREDPAGTPRGEGIGLAMSRKLAFANGGALRAEINARGGMDFVLELPAADGGTQ